MGVIQREPALRRQADEAMAALDDRRAEILLELADRRRERRLRDVTGFRRPAKVLFTRQRDEIFELPQTPWGTVARAARPRIPVDSVGPGGISPRAGRQRPAAFRPCEEQGEVSRESRGLKLLADRVRLTLGCRRWLSAMGGYRSFCVAT